MNESLRRLEEKIAYLERHVTEQDKAMLELAEELAGLRREMKRLREQVVDAVPPRPAGDDERDERPPHY